MKNKFVLGLLSVVTILSFTAAISVKDEDEDFSSPDCDSRIVKIKCKPLLEPYYYDNSQTTKLITKPEAQVKEIEVPLFIGEKYKIVFSTADLNKKVIVSIYNKRKNVASRELLFSNKDLPAKQTEFTYEIKRAVKMYIDYEIPAGADNESVGCVGYVMGFQ